VGRALTVEQLALLRRTHVALGKLGYAVPSGGLGDLASLKGSIEKFVQDQGSEFSRAVSALPTPEARAQAVVKAAEGRVSRIGVDSTLRALSVAAAGFVAYRTVKKHGPGALAGALNNLASVIRR
jgi:hypothetical protein